MWVPFRMHSSRCRRSLSYAGLNRPAPPLPPSGRPRAGIELAAKSLGGSCEGGASWTGEE